MIRDKGVRSDYIDRAFSAEDGETKYRKGLLTREQLDCYYEAKSQRFQSERKQALEDFRMVQESRPLKPRGAIR